MGFSKKKTNFSKIVKGGKFAVECVSNDVISQNVLSTLVVKFFCRRIRKFSNFGKLKNMKSIF